MDPVPINWRPLGELFVETGLITGDELDEALTEQAVTKQRLGQILVSRGFVSEPELTTVLLDQIGRDLQSEEEPGSLVVDLARRRASRPVSTKPEPEHESAGDVEPARDATATTEPADLLRDMDELREQQMRETALRQTAANEATSALEARVGELEASLVREQAEHRRALDELDRVRGEARAQASELRSSIGRLRAELAQLDAATAWFEYWSGGTQPSAPPSGAPPTG